MTFPKPLLFALLLVVLGVFGAIVWWSGTRNELASNDFDRTARSFSAKVKNLELQTTAEVELVAGNSGEVILTGNEDILEAVDLVEEGDTLRIEAKPQTLEVLTWGREELILKIQSPTPFENLKFAGDVLVSGRGVRGDKASIKGEGQLDGQLLANQADELAVEIVGTGDLEIKGDATASTYTSRGAATIDARDLASRSTVAEVIGRGVIRTRTQAQLQARVEGEGAILYTQTPAQLQSQVNGSGVVKLSD